MDKKTLTVFIIALAIGGAAGWFFHSSPEKAADDLPQETAAPKHLKDDKGADASVRALRLRVRELERLLAKAKQDAAAKPAEPPPQKEEKVADKQERGPFRPPTAADFKKHMEEIAKNDPQRYTEMTNRMAHFRTHRLQRMQDRLELLASVNTSRMTTAQKKAHDEYQDLLVKREELFEIFRPDNDSITEEERMTAGKEIHELNDRIRELANAERETLLSQTAESFGIRIDDVAEFTETVKAVYDITEGRGGWHGGPGGGRHGGGPGGGRHGGGPGGRGGPGHGRPVPQGAK